MKTKASNSIRTAGIVVIGFLILGGVGLVGAADPSPKDHSSHQPQPDPHPQVAGRGLAEFQVSLESLKVEVAQLRELLSRQSPSTGAASMNMSGADSASGGMGMGMMKGMGMGGGSMAGMNMSGTDSASGGMGMGMGMGRMKMMGMAPMQTHKSSLPGFPGASHIYHIGASDFFLDHADHLNLTLEQTTKLNQIKEKTALAQASASRSVAESEQQLWQLTASDQPDAEAIEAKIREIERLNGNQRLQLIRAVGEAALVLTHDQHVLLTGHSDAASNHSQH